MKPTVLICAAGLFLAACKSEPCPPGDSMASIMAARFVESQIRSPASASFGPHSRAQIIDVTECHYRVRNYVDAQNGFGATIRQNFTVEITRQPDAETWNVENWFIGS